MNYIKILPGRMEVYKVNKLVASVHDKTNYVTYLCLHIYALKQALNHGLILKNVHAVISFYHATWLKSYIDMNTENTR